MGILCDEFSYEAREIYSEAVQVNFQFTLESPGGGNLELKQIQKLNLGPPGEEKPA